MKTGALWKSCVRDRSITITPEIYCEVVAQARRLAGSREVEVANWISIQRLLDPVALSAVRHSSRLGLGEASAILLAKQVHADRVLIDEVRARRFARDQGLEVMGTVGVLAEAH